MATSFAVDTLREITHPANETAPHSAISDGLFGGFFERLFSRLVESRMAQARVEIARHTSFDPQHVRALELFARD